MSDVIKELNKPIYLRVEDNTRFTEEENLVLKSIIEFMKKIDPQPTGITINYITKDNCKIDVSFLDCDSPLHIGYNFTDNFICYNRSDVMEGIYINDEEEAIKKITEYSRS